MGNGTTNSSGTRGWLIAIVVLLCLVALFQIGLLLQRHLARPHSGGAAKPAPTDIVWNPEDEIALMHARINRMFNQAFTPHFSSHPPAVGPSPGTPDGSADAYSDDPFEHMRHLQHQIDALFSGFLSSRDLNRTGFDEGWTRLTITPGLTVRDTGDAYEITVQLPGVDKSDIHVHMDHAVLTLVVEQNLKTSTPGWRGSPEQHALQTSRFERHLRLPGATGKPDSIRATYKNEVLTIRVPKAPPEDKAAQSIPIQ